MSLLVEMRTDRDLIRSELKAVNQCVEQMKQVRSDISRISRDLLETRDRVTRMEALVHEQSGMAKRIQKHAETVSQLKSHLDTSLTMSTECREQIGLANSSFTQRLNNMELMIRQHVKPAYVPASSPNGINVMQCGSNVPQNTHVRPIIRAPPPQLSQPVGGHLDIGYQQHQNHQLQPPPSKTQTDPVVTHVVQQQRQHPQSPPNIQTNHIVQTSGGGAVQQQVPLHIPDKNDRSVHFSGQQDMNGSVTVVVQTNKDDTMNTNATRHPAASSQGSKLRGYVKNKDPRPKGISLYLGGIFLLNNDMHETLETVKYYVADRSVTLLSIRKLTISKCGAYVSAKLSVNEGDETELLKEGYWPDDMWCRYWE